MMDAPNFSDMSSEDILTLIEGAQKALDQKIAAEKADIEERQMKLIELESRRGGNETKPNAKPSAPKSRGRPAQFISPKAAEQSVLAEA